MSILHPSSKSTENTNKQQQKHTMTTTTTTTTKEQHSQSQSLHPTQPFTLTNTLKLTPRIKLNLTLHRSDTSVTPLDEWKLKNSLLSFLKTSFTHPIAVPFDDLIVRRFKDLNKRKRGDPVAVGSLFVRDLGFVEGGGDDGESFREWRDVIREKMDGMEVNLEGVKFRVGVDVPKGDDFDGVVKEWQEFFAFGHGSYSRSGKKEPDTIILRGLPSRWFAEPRVSSKPSMLVTHTIFSTLGKIRNLHVAEDDDFGKDADEDDEDLISGLHCKVVVQFEQHKDFYNAFKVLCSHSLQKEGSRMKADYELSWDKDGFFNSTRRRTQDRNGRMMGAGIGEYRKEGPRRPSYSSRYSPDEYSKRFKR